MLLLHAIYLVARGLTLSEWRTSKTANWVVPSANGIRNNLGWFFGLAVTGKAAAGGPDKAFVV